MPNEKKRIRSLEIDPLAYRREAPQGAVEVVGLKEKSYDQQTVLVGRLMLADHSGVLSRLGVYAMMDGREVVTLEKIEGNGCSISAYLVRTPENIQQVNSLIHYGDIVMLRGVKRHKDAEDYFLADSISLLAKAVGDVHDTGINLSKRGNLYAHRHLDLIRDPEKLRHFRRCSQILHIIREFLYQAGYDELSLTLLQESFEAGLADPFVTHVIAHDRDMYLRLTSELMLRKLMIAGFSRVFELGKSFRNQGATAEMHPQFTILELYQAYATSEDMETFIRDMICAILGKIYGVIAIPTAHGQIDCSGEWPIYFFKEEVLKLTGVNYDESRPLADLVTLLDKAKIPHPVNVNKYSVACALYGRVMSGIRGPAFLRNLPAAQSPLFRVNDDGSTVDETILVIDGMLVADLVNPERDPNIIRQKMAEQLTYRRDPAGEINEDLIRAMEFGLPPCRGIGLGVERLMKLLLNVGSIRDVDLFPVF